MDLKKILLILILIKPIVAFADQCLNIETVYDQISNYSPLKFKNKVLCSEKSRPQVLEYLNETITRQIPDQKLEYDQFVLKTLKLLPKSYDYKSNIIKLYQKQIAGYYDPYQKSFSIADWLPERLDRVVAIHELTHALQDQHYNLLKFITPDMTTDQSMARAATIEGDATFMMYDLGQSKGSGGGLKDIQNIDELTNLIRNKSLDLVEFKDAPRVIKESMVFPYSYGLKFVFTVKKLYGLNYLSSPPNFTSEILYPEEINKPLTVAEISCEKIDNHKVLYEDRLGEYFYLLLIDQDNFPKSRIWNGDKACVYGKSDGSSKFLILKSKWINQEIIAKLKILFLKFDPKKTTIIHQPENTFSVRIDS